MFCTWHLHLNICIKDTMMKLEWIGEYQNLALLFWCIGVSNYHPAQTWMGPNFSRLYNSRGPWSNLLSLRFAACHLFRSRHDVTKICSDSHEHGKYCYKIILVFYLASQSPSNPPNVESIPATVKICLLLVNQKITYW